MQICVNKRKLKLKYKWFTRFFDVGLFNFHPIFDHFQMVQAKRIVEKTDNNYVHEFKWNTYGNILFLFYGMDLLKRFNMMDCLK